MSDKETHEIVLHGKWSAFEDRGDWRQFEIIVEGKQYPYKLSTKRAETIEAMMAVRDVEEVTFYGAEQESDKINERAGKPYMNRYLNDVKEGLHDAAIFPGSGGSSSGGSSSSSSSSGSGGGGGGGGGTYGDYSPEAVARIEEAGRRSYSSKAWAHALTMLNPTFRSDEPVDDLFKRVQALQRRIYVDICGEWGKERDESYFPEQLRGDPQAKAAQVDAPAASGGRDNADEPPADDDIPF